eukprot:CAMPEP_0116559494 /NCGR_PEP_ID=MMETSP0397-20121206/10429_1 /TAXON_ID=216820 /ORGANISM="Cyclophora tenuis, Strain ECT3854" /LENGTH=201 /DNA_ID=CAMNT_0004085273 /DNA_START=67 /DNA_END=672 /DNA_ORIENTATION=-
MATKTRRKPRPRRASSSVSPSKASMTSRRPKDVQPPLKKKSSSSSSTPTKNNKSVRKAAKASLAKKSSPARRSKAKKKMMEEFIAKGEKNGAVVVEHDTKEVFWEVEKVLEKRKRGTKVECKIRWKGCGADQDTWEPERNLSDSAMEEASALSFATSPSKGSKGDKGGTSTPTKKSSASASSGSKGKGAPTAEPSSEKGSS